MPCKPACAKAAWQGRLTLRKLMYLSTSSLKNATCACTRSTGYVGSRARQTSATLKAHGLLTGCCFHACVHVACIASCAICMISTCMVLSMHACCHHPTPAHLFFEIRILFDHAIVQAGDRRAERALLPACVQIAARNTSHGRKKAARPQKNASSRRGKTTAVCGVIAGCRAFGR